MKIAIIVLFLLLLPFKIRIDAVFELNKLEAGINIYINKKFYFNCAIYVANNYIYIKIGKLPAKVFLYKKKKNNNAQILRMFDYEQIGVVSVIGIENAEKTMLISSGINTVMGMFTNYLKVSKDLNMTYTTIPICHLNNTTIYFQVNMATNFLKIFANFIIIILSTLTNVKGEKNAV